MKLLVINFLLHMYSEMLNKNLTKSEVEITFSTKEYKRAASFQNLELLGILLVWLQIPPNFLAKCPLDFSACNV